MENQILKWFDEERTKGTNAKAIRLYNYFTDVLADKAGDNTFDSSELIASIMAIIANIAVQTVKEDRATKESVIKEIFEAIEESMNLCFDPEMKSVKITDYLQQASS